MFSSNPLAKIPTAAAIDTAIKNGEKAIREGYKVERSNHILWLWFVIKPNTDGRDYYMVTTDKGNEQCNCPQFELEGVCKHQYCVDHRRRCDEVDEIEQAKIDERYADVC